MDTDDLSEMAWEIIARAAQVSDTLKAELGTRSGKYNSEDDWLRGVLKFRTYSQALRGNNVPPDLLMRAPSR